MFFEIQLFYLKKFSWKEIECEIKYLLAVI
jgi:hypothetical protein